MFNLLIGIFIRIFSNSYLNVFQKLLTQKGEHPSGVNFYTYLGLTLIGISVCPHPLYTEGLWTDILTMGFLGATGNYFIIKALSSGELSTLAPINSYKPVIALIISFLLLKEIPGAQEGMGIFLIILGTLVLGGSKILYNKATIYRFIALILLGTEAVFIKKVIISTDINSTFLYWVATGLFCATIVSIFSKHQLKIKTANIKYQLILITMVALMQYTTNYVFARMNVAYALALFQLSTITSVFLGVNIFKEKGLVKKLIAASIMISGALLIILR